MKFLCVPCDEQMKLKHAIGPEGGSVALVYACPACSAEMAMMTNPHETQVVGSLGVKIGAAEDPEAAAAASKCPFTGMLADMGVPVTGTRAAENANPVASGNGGPGGIPWTAEARERLANIPDIVRTSAVAGIEKFAEDHGYEEVDAAVLERARSFFGIA
ncbi:MAG: PCP reductase family protein [Acidobacteriota bacterium]|nr:PCP reductase family protein [Acidobacteriota bacterium]